MREFLKVIGEREIRDSYLDMAKLTWVCGWVGSPDSGRVRPMGRRSEVKTKLTQFEFLLRRARRGHEGARRAFDTDFKF